jgi:hypothetical protein
MCYLTEQMLPGRKTQMHPDKTLQPDLSRRQAMQSGAALCVLLFAGPAGATPSALPAMTIYRDPGCGCCGNWAALARRAGFAARVIDSADMPGIKRRLGVPRSLEACHTAVVGGYVIEGHVPFDRIARLLERHPRGIRGLAVPGMPLGSPGMEVPGAPREPFQVFAFDAAGHTTVLR